MITVVQRGLCAVFLCLLMINCTKKHSVEDQFPKDQTLWVNWGTEPPTLDWTLANDIVSANLVLNLMEPLIGIDLNSESLEVKPGLFKSWEPNKNYTQWTFTLADNVLWSDGLPLTMQHVLDGFERLLHPATGAEAATYIYAIKNAEKYHLKKLTDFTKVGLKQIDEKTLLITLETPLVFFPKILTVVNTMPIRKDLIEKYKGQWTEPQNLVTLGAYQLTEWKHDERIVLKANSKYFGKKAKIPFIAGRMIEDLTAATKLFESGKLDIHRGLTPNDEKRFEKRPEFKKQSSLAVLYFNFNTREPPFNSPTARKLFVQAINRKQVVSVLGGYRRANTAWLPQGLLGSIESEGLPFDIKAALEGFQQLNDEQRHRLQEVTVESNTNETHKIMLENIQAQLKTNLGIQVEIQMLEWKSYLQKIRSLPASIFRLGFISAYPDPHFLMSLWKSNSHFNMTGWGSREYDELVDKAAVETNITKRQELYRQAQKILIEEAPFFAVYSASNLSLVSGRVKNYKSNAVERLIFKDLSL